MKLQGQLTSYTWDMYIYYIYKAVSSPHFVKYLATSLVSCQCVSNNLAIPEYAPVVLGGSEVQYLSSGVVPDLKEHKCTWARVNQSDLDDNKTGLPSALGLDSRE